MDKRDILNFINDLDGYGLVITDEELIEERIKEIAEDYFPE